MNDVEQEFYSFLRKIIIILQITAIIILLIISQVRAVPAGNRKHFLMTVTGYSIHPHCIAKKYNDGYTATMTPIREGVVAINVDYINGEWKVKSPLKLGDKIYIEGIGNYSVEDTGRFAERNHTQDMWTVDIYMEDYNEAVKFGRKLKKVFVID